jgi:Tfp pilus assembly protein PilF
VTPKNSQERRGGEGPARYSNAGTGPGPRIELILVAILVFLAAWIHAGSLGGAARPESRQPEDNLVCWSNPAVTSPGLGPALRGWFYDPTNEGFRNAVRPLPLVFLRAEHSAFGESGTGFRVIQILLLGLTGVLLFLLLEAWWGSILAAAFGAMFLVVHPLAVTAVVGIAGVADLLALPLLLCGLWSVVRGRGTIGAILLVLLATLCKEMAFAVIPAVGVWAWARIRSGTWPGGGGRGKDPVVRFALGSGVAGLAVLLYRAVVMWTLPHQWKIARAVEAGTSLGLGKRTLVGLAGVFESFRIVLFPAPIGYATDYLVASSLTPLRAAAGLVLCVAMGWGLVRAVRRGAPEALWIALVLFPVLGASGLFFPTGAILPPRTLLFMVPGMAGLVAWGARRVLARYPGTAPRRILPLLGLVVLGLLGWRALARVGDYRSWDSLVQRETTQFPRSARGWYDLGNIRLSRGDNAAAREAYDAALKQRPDCWEAWLNLGVTYAAQKDWGLAMRAFTQVLDGTNGRASLRIVWARARYHQGLVYMTQAKNTDAARCFEDMLAVFPDHLYSHANLGMLYSNSDKLDDLSRAHLERALQLETVPERRKTLETYLDGLTKRREKEDRRKVRLSGGAVPGAVPVDSLP